MLPFCGQLVCHVVLVDVADVGDGLLIIQLLWSHLVIVFCTTVRNRTFHLERTLPKNLIDNRGSDAKFVILNYNSQDHLNHYLQTEHWQAMDEGRLVVYNFTEPTQFRMAHAKNMVHRLGIMEGADILVNLDADNFTEAGFAGYVQDKFREPNVFLCGRKIRGRQGISGRIVVSAKDFINTGGYDEKYETHSPDDMDFNCRLQRLGVTPVEIDPNYLHCVSHTDRLRFRDYPEAKWNPTTTPYDLEELYAGIRNATSTIANYGNFGCGVVFRNFSAHPMEVMPVPTRVFGIGLHKTATTSLHRAFKVLGMDSVHWETGDWARDVFDELRTVGRSITMEKHYAISDLPISMFYRELDRTYPGSKFILTLREEQKWLESVRRHWGYDTNRFRWEWDRYPVSNKIHKALYGRKDFDAETFLKRYRQHTMEVKEYFKRRRRDLLIMDMDNNAGWPQLCGFLKKSIPSVPYPVEYVTESVTATV